MDVGTGGLTSTTDGPDDLTLLDTLSNRDIIFAHVSIECLGAISVTNDYICPVTTVVSTGARDYNLTVRRSKNWNTGRSRQVNPIVAVNTLSLSPADYRSEIETRIHGISLRSGGFGQRGLSGADDTIRNDNDIAGLNLGIGSQAVIRKDVVEICFILGGERLDGIARLNDVAHTRDWQNDQFLSFFY